ncbi:unnamed protein product [Linum trigynum]|uniref:Uncharacterized protein n=1 Tax=Linum trigynum TaxID=586398 RepID=A0AAV2FCU2_9ROSI
MAPPVTSPSPCSSSLDRRESQLPLGGPVLHRPHLSAPDPGMIPALISVRIWWQCWSWTERKKRTQPWRWLFSREIQITLAFNEAEN